MPILAASLMTDEAITLNNVPNVIDIHNMFEILRNIGANVNANKNTVRINTSNSRPELGTPLARTIRYSINMLGPLLLRHGYAVIPLPGGCRLGIRKINSHISGLEKLGAQLDIDLKNCVIKASCTRLKGAEINFEYPSVSATEHIMSTATLAEGSTILYNAAKEPEIVDLAVFLNSMGAKIRGAGTETIHITGVKDLKGLTYSVMPDRIETGTFIIAAAMTKGEISIVNACIDHLEAFIDVARAIGIEVNVKKTSVKAKMSRRANPCNITTDVYPYFPTDLQPPISALLSIANGTSLVKDNIFPERFSHVKGLCKMGAKIKVASNTSTINGVESLFGAEIDAPDIRAGITALLGALNAEGETIITDTNQIDRGYENVHTKLAALGAHVKVLV